MRLFVGVPIWTPFNRPQDDHPIRWEQPLLEETALLLAPEVMLYSVHCECGGVLLQVLGRASCLVGYRTLPAHVDQEFKSPQLLPNAKLQSFCSGMLKSCASWGVSIFISNLFVPDIPNLSDFIYLNDDYFRGSTYHTYELTEWFQVANSYIFLYLKLTKV